MNISKKLKRNIVAFSAGFAILLATPIEIEGITLNVEASEISRQQEFFNIHGETASKVASENGLYASVMLAQMALESNYGKSGLSKSPVNNLFGIKGSYNGKSISLSTKEDDGKGNLYTIQAKFRSYPSAEESMADYANLINHSGYYSKAIKANAVTYEDATKALQGVYATDTQYASKLNYIISTYNLTNYDVVEEPSPTEEKTVDEKIKEHTIVFGDTLSELAEYYQTTVAEIQTLNNLDSDLIIAGEKLLIQLPIKKETHSIERD